MCSYLLIYNVYYTMTSSNVYSINIDGFSNNITLSQYDISNIKKCDKCIIYIKNKVISACPLIRLLKPYSHNKIINITYDAFDLYSYNSHNYCFSLHNNKIKVYVDFVELCTSTSYIYIHNNKNIDVPSDFILDLFFLFKNFNIYFYRVHKHNQHNNIVDYHNIDSSYSGGCLTRINDRYINITEYHNSTLCIESCYDLFNDVFLYTSNYRSSPPYYDVDYNYDKCNDDYSDDSSIYYDYSSKLFL